MDLSLPGGQKHRLQLNYNVSVSVKCVTVALHIRHDKSNSNYTGLTIITTTWAEMWLFIYKK